LAKTTYSTGEAARKIGVSLRTLNNWLADGKIKPSHGHPYGGNRTLWVFTDADIAKGRKIKGTQKPGPKPKGWKP
jgi:DNA-binding transcriptional MerR regulator